MRLTLTVQARRLIARARQTAQVRLVQLLQCRVCGDDAVEQEAVVALLRDLETQLENVDVQAVQPQP